jgi:Magnesium chelatase, subunit ChlI
VQIEPLAAARGGVKVSRNRRHLSSALHNCWHVQTRCRCVGDNLVVSLAHQGMLFLDALPEFRRHPLEVLRQPIKALTIITQCSTVAHNPLRDKPSGMEDIPWQSVMLKRGDS